jgi:hypothetical protein
MAVVPAVVVTVVAMLAGEATLAVVELVVEAEVVDVEDGVDDAVRELWPVDGRLKIMYVNHTKPVLHCQISAHHEVCTSLSLYAQKRTLHLGSGYNEMMSINTFTPSYSASAHLPAQTLFIVH